MCRLRDFAPRFLLQFISFSLSPRHSSLPCCLLPADKETLVVISAPKKEKSFHSTFFLQLAKCYQAPFFSFFFLQEQRQRQVCGVAGVKCNIPMNQPSFTNPPLLCPPPPAGASLHANGQLNGSGSKGGHKDDGSLRSQGLDGGKYGEDGPAKKR